MSSTTPAADSLDVVVEIDRSIWGRLRAWVRGFLWVSVFLNLDSGPRTLVIVRGRASGQAIRTFEWGFDHSGALQAAGKMRADLETLDAAAFREKW